MDFGLIRAVAGQSVCPEHAGLRDAVVKLLAQRVRVRVLRALRKAGKWVRAEDAADGRDRLSTSLVAAEQGLHVTSIGLREPRDGPAVAVVQTTLLPRAATSALARQLAVLPCLEWVRVPSDPDQESYGTWVSTGNFVAVVRATVGEDVLFDAAFCGYPAGNNVAQRFVPEVACKVLAESLRDARWETREPTDADRAFVAAIGPRLPASQRWWTGKRLQKLGELLAPR